MLSSACLEGSIHAASPPKVPFRSNSQLVTLEQDVYLRRELGGTQTRVNDVSLPSITSLCSAAVNEMA